MTEQTNTPSPASRLPDWFWPVVGICLYWLPLYLLQRDMYDGVPLAFAYEHKLYDGFREWQLGSAWHLAYVFHMTLFQVAQWLDVPRMLVVKLALLGAFVGLYFQYRWYLASLFRLPPGEARAFAFLAALFVSPQIYAASLGIMLPFFIWAGLAGYRLLRHAGWPARVAGLALVVVSFQLNSMLVFVLALHVAFAAAQGRVDRRDWVLLAVLATSAVGFFLARKFVFPPSGPYAGYNALRLPTSLDSLRSVARAALMYLTWMIIPLSALALSLGWLKLRGQWQFNGWPRGDQRRLWLTRAGIAVFLFAAGAFPYAMVAKGAPLFTATALGNGVTEQALRQAWSGPLAPGFSLTSGRQGVLLMLPLAMLLFMATTLARELFARSPRALGLRATTAMALVAMLPWIGGGAWSRLAQQHAEIALVKGLAQLPAPPAGFVEVRYAPVTDWFLHNGPASQIAAQAWGRSHYFAVIYSLEAFRQEMHWLYSAYIKDIGGLRTPWIQHAHSMIDYPGERCISRYEATLPRAGFFEVVTAGLRPGAVSPAVTIHRDTDCRDDNRIDNPMPGRPATF